jgi:uncharacterized protein with LGFP repeats
MHFAAWMNNTQPYCDKNISSSDIAEIDTMELYSAKNKDTHTTHVSCSTNDSGKITKVRDSHTLKKADVYGKWHTFKAVWDGYAVEYFFDGKAVPESSTSQTKTTGETVGLPQRRFQDVLNNYKWRVIIDNRVFPKNSFQKPPDDTKVFKRRVDTVDYVRMKKLTSVSPAGVIKHYWEANGAEDGSLGYPKGALETSDEGEWQAFEGGTVFWNKRTGKFFVVKGGALNEYVAIGGVKSSAGFPTSNERKISGGVSQSFEHGQIHWSAKTHGHFTSGGIQKYWQKNKWQDGRLGYPVGDEVVYGDGSSQEFEGGRVFLNKETGSTYTVKGGIGTSYAARKGQEGDLGYPSAEELSVKGGASQKFEHGTLFWNSKTHKVFAVSGEIRTKYASLKWEQGLLGFPTSEQRSLKTGGVSQSFEKGQIHWSESSKAHYTTGGIKTYWSKNGWENGALGYPTGDEIKVAGGASQTFQGGIVFWNSKRGKAFLVLGGVRNAYRALRYERGFLGLPVSEERSLEGGVSQSFEKGQIHWSAETHGHATHGAIQNYWAKSGWEKGWLGYPTSEETSVSNGAKQTFQGGTLTWNSKTRKVTG